MSAIVSRLYLRYRNSVQLVTGSWYLIGSFIDKFILFLAVPIFANLLTTAQFGTVAIFSTWLSIFSTVLTLNVESSVLNARFEFDDKQFNQFVSSILMFGLLLCSGAFLLFSFLPESWLEAVFELSRPVILLAVIGAAFTLPYNILSSIWRARYDYKLINISKISLTTGSITISVVLILVPPLFITSYDAALGRILGTLLINVLLGIVLIRQRLSLRTLHINRQHLSFALHISLPLIAHSISTLLLSRADQVLIDHFIGRSATGIYSLAYRIGDLTTVIWSAANSVWVIWFFNHMKKNNAQVIRRYANYYVLAFGGMSALFMFLGPVILHILAPPTYWSASNIVPVIMLGGFFTMLYSLYTGVEFYEKKTGMIATVTVIAASVNVILNLILLPRYGYSIAAWTTAVSYACFFLLHAAGVIFRIRKGYLFNFWLFFLVSVILTFLAGFLYFMIG